MDKHDCKFTLRRGGRVSLAPSIPTFLLALRSPDWRCPLCRRLAYPYQGPHPKG